jgi:hypothetical protein
LLKRRFLSGVVFFFCTFPEAVMALLFRGRIWAAIAASALAIPAMAAPGDSFILPIDHTQDGTFTDLPGGYNGDRAVAHTGSGGDVARVYWVVPNSVDPDPQLYKISWWAAPGSEGPQGNAYQPFEVQYNGVAGDSTMDPNIPWHGQFGTNHQWLTNNNGSTTVSAFNITGPGPQAPGDVSDPGTGSPANPPEADGNSVWLKPGSEIFVKWDFGFYTNTTNVVSDLQITQVPEPVSLCGMFLGGGFMMMRRRRRVV